MKSPLFLFTLLNLLFLASLSAQQTTTMSLVEAVEAGSASVEIRGGKAGSYFGECLRFQLRNLLEDSLEVQVKSGQKLICDTKEIQNMIITKSFTIRLAAHGKEQRRIYAMCGEKHDGSPEAHHTFQVGEMTTGNTFKIANTIEKNNKQDLVGQFAMWSCTDLIPKSDLALWRSSELLSEVQKLLDEAGVEVPMNSNSTAKTGTDPVSEPVAIDLVPDFDWEGTLFLVGFWVVMGIGGIALLVAVFRKRETV